MARNRTPRTAQAAARAILAINNHHGKPTNEKIRRIAEADVKDIVMKQPYPYNEGDVNVLGPEIFASTDESVICWKGVNYIKQDRAEQMEEDAWDRGWNTAADYYLDV